MFMFGAFILIKALVECFLSINTGRGCLACETSVMQQLSTRFLLTVSVLDYYAPASYILHVLCFTGNVGPL